MKTLLELYEELLKYAARTSDLNSLTKEERLRAEKEANKRIKKMITQAKKDGVL